MWYEIFELLGKNASYGEDIWMFHFFDLLSDTKNIKRILSERGMSLKFDGAYIDFRIQAMGSWDLLGPQLDLRNWE